jgi:hypothetical protein
MLYTVRLAHAANSCQTARPWSARDLVSYLTDDSRLSTVILDLLLKVELSRGVRARM